MSYESVAPYMKGVMVWYGLIWGLFSYYYYSCQDCSDTTKLLLTKSTTRQIIDFIGLILLVVILVLSNPDITIPSTESADLSRWMWYHGGVILAVISFMFVFEPILSKSSYGMISTQHANSYIMLSCLAVCALAITYYNYLGDGMGGLVNTVIHMFFIAVILTIVYGYLPKESKTVMTYNPDTTSMDTATLEVTVYHLNTSLSYMSFFLLYIFFTTPTIGSTVLHGFLTGLLICSTMAYGFYGLVFDSYSLEYGRDSGQLRTGTETGTLSASASSTASVSASVSSDSSTASSDSGSSADYTLMEQIGSIIAVLILIGLIAYAVI
jgi:hypothetical protein